MKYPIGIEDLKTDTIYNKFEKGKWYVCVKPSVKHSRHFNKNKLYLCCGEDIEENVYLVDNEGDIVHENNLGGKFVEAKYYEKQKNEN